MKAMSFKATRTTLFLSLYALLLATFPAAAQRRGDDPSLDSTEILVTAKAGKLEKLAKKLGREPARIFDAGKRVEIGVFVLEPGETAAGVLEEWLDQRAVYSAHTAGATILPEHFEDVFLDQSTMAILGALEDSGESSFDDEDSDSHKRSGVWSGYVDQPAVRLLDLDRAHKTSTGKGAVVAIIDTGIDSEHALFAGHLVKGYDFLLDEEGLATDTVLLDQSTMAILGQSTMAILGQSTMAILGQSTMAILGEDQARELEAIDLPPSLGHGTMVAGVVRRAAPDAELMPLRVFDGSGYARISDIVEAIYYAVRKKVTVINMSFHLDALPPELEVAIEYATDRGIVCVSATGNHGLSGVMVHPAGLKSSIGVAATDDADFVASFSNVGVQIATAGAPGVSVITSFVGGGWAAASGTSFAAPWLSGAVALFADKSGDGKPGSVDLKQSERALHGGKRAKGAGAQGIKFGRTNVADALSRVKKAKH